MATQTLTLTEFLLARIAEDEAAARAVRGETEWATKEDVAPGRDSGVWLVVSERREYEFPVETIASLHMEFPLGGERRTAEHIARHDPARVLAESEAKRRIVELHHNPHGYGYCPVCMGAGEVPESEPCPTVQLVALPYADHPDYRDEWRP